MDNTVKYRPLSFGKDRNLGERGLAGKIVPCITTWAAVTKDSVIN